MTQEALVRASSENVVVPPLNAPPGMTPSAKGGVTAVLTGAVPPIRIAAQPSPDRAVPSIGNATETTPTT